MPQVTHINLAKGFRGGERQTELLVRGLAERGVPQRVVVRRDQPLQARLAGIEGVQIRPVRKPFIANLSAFKDGFLHAHDGRGAHVAHWAHAALGVPYVITRRVDNRPSRSWATCRTFRRAAGVAVLSQAIQRVMQSHSPGLNTVCIPSASCRLEPDTARAAALRSEWGGEFVVGQVGALDDSHKGQRDLIEAARILLKEDDSWRFVFAGSGKDEAMLRQAARGMERRVAFAGHVENVGDHLASFDVMAYPSIHEGLGSTLLDGMGVGLPIVATDVDGIPEFVRNELEGLLIPSRDPVALAAALRRLRKEPQLARRLADAGIRNAAGYTPDIMAERYLDWYRSLGFHLVDQTSAAPTAASHRP